MQFKEIRCLIPRFNRQTGQVEPCDRYLCDIKANAPITIRCRCKNDHEAGHSNQTEFTQDSAGVITYREISPDTDRKGYVDNGVRLPMTEQEIAG